MKTIFIPISKAEINNYLNDVNYEMKGDRQDLTEKDFEILWKKNIFYKFYLESDVFIDDKETTVIEDTSKLIFLKMNLENVSFLKYKLFKISKRILPLVDLAIERESGIIFFF